LETLSCFGSGSLSLYLNDWMHQQLDYLSNTVKFDAPNLVFFNPALTSIVILEQIIQIFVHTYNSITFDRECIICCNLKASMVSKFFLSKLWFRYGSLYQCWHNERSAHGIRTPCLMHLRCNSFYVISFS